MSNPPSRPSSSIHPSSIVDHAAALGADHAAALGADHAAALGIERITPVPRPASGSQMPSMPPPPPISRSLPPPLPPNAGGRGAPSRPELPSAGPDLTDQPTRHLVLPPTIEQPTPAKGTAQPRLSLPQTFADGEGTAALLLPPRNALSQRRGQTRRRPRQWLINLWIGLLGGAGMLLLMVFVLRQWTAHHKPAGQLESAAEVQSAATVDGARQQLIDEALRAVQAGKLDEAIDLLERSQREKSDPTVDRMISSLKRQRENKR